IIRGNHCPDHRHKHQNERNRDFPPFVRFSLSESPGEGIWTPFADFRSFIRSAVEVTGIEDEITYDVTELVAYESVDVDADLCDWARRQTAEEFMLNYKVIVLTEGNVDRICIEGALRILYPHLTDYYSFMDFDIAR